MVGAKLISLSSCLTALAAAESSCLKDKEEGSTGMKGVKVTQYIPQGGCEGDPVGEVTYWEGCWTMEEGERSQCNEIDGDEWTVRHFDGPACDDDDEDEDKKEEGEIDKKECTREGQIFEEDKMDGDYYHYENYGKKGEGCEAKDLEIRMVFRSKDMRDGKCDQKGKKVWKITTVSEDGSTITEERFEDKNCDDPHPDWPTLVIPATGACTQIDDLDEDEDEITYYVKLFYTNEEGRSSSGHALQLSHGVLALTSFAGLVATLI